MVPEFFMFCKKILPACLHAACKKFKQSRLGLLYFHGVLLYLLDGALVLYTIPKFRPYSDVP